MVDTMTDSEVERDAFEQAGIDDFIEGPTGYGSLTGRLPGWIIKAGRRYWIAEVRDGNLGLPLDVAEELHNREYPDQSKAATYGKVVRVHGNAGCPPPKEWAMPDLGEALARIGKDSVSLKEIRDACLDGTLDLEMYVSTYHIDTQEGLDEFVRVVKNLA